MLVSLSYKLSEATPFYQGLRKPALEPLYELAKGDACNSLYLTTSNHAGTHVDGPNHFNVDGRRISDYRLEELAFTRPAVVDMDVPDDLLIRRKHLEGVRHAGRDCDMLLLRSGFGRYRETDPQKYVERSPGFSREAAEYLISALPELRAVVVDFISIASLLHEHEGAEAHRVFLGCRGYSDRTVLLVEDAFLPDSLQAPKHILIVPWGFEGLDSAPCTIIAEL